MIVAWGHAATYIHRLAAVFKKHNMLPESDALLLKHDEEVCKARSENFALLNVAISDDAKLTEKALVKILEKGGQKRFT